MIRRVHHRGRDCLVEALEVAAGALADAHVRQLVLLGATMIWLMASTTFGGCLPVAVSADSMTASLPSMTAFATSETSRALESC